MRALLAGAATLGLLAAQEAGLAAPAVTGARGSATAAPAPFVVLFTHIEDNTPAGALGTPANRTAYIGLRARLLEMATLAQRYGVRWSLQPDWKILLAAQQYENDDVMAPTGGVNVLRYLRDSLGVAIDPHSHENGGYNYTDVAHLLERLGVGGSTVIGGHIWDPSLPQFQGWDRYRVPVPGERYPEALWRGEILMGSGTPNHVADPIVSGVWRPQDRDHYWTDDPAGNIACVGAFRGDLPGIAELVDLYRSAAVEPGCMLTASFHVRPADLTSPGGLLAIEDTVIRPLAEARDQGLVVLTDFTSLVGTWHREFGGRSCTYVVSLGR